MRCHSYLVAYCDKLVNGKKHKNRKLFLPDIFGDLARQFFGARLPAIAGTEIARHWPAKSAPLVKMTLQWK